jgi:hypothetical protein
MPCYSTLQCHNTLLQHPVLQHNPVTALCYSTTPCYSTLCYSTTPLQPCVTAQHPVTAPCVTAPCNSTTPGYSTVCYTMPCYSTVQHPVLQHNALLQYRVTAQHHSTMPCYRGLIDAIDACAPRSIKSLLPSLIPTVRAPAKYHCTCARLHMYKWCTLEDGNNTHTQLFLAVQNSAMQNY